MKKIIVLALAAAMTAAMVGCAGKNEEKVATDGSTAMEKVIGALGEAFMEEYDVDFTYNPTGSGTGITAVKDGLCDIGLSSRELKEEELESGLNATVLAYDGIAVIVNKDNPIIDLDVDTVKKIYTKEITNWSEIGGRDEEIVLIGREAGSGTRDGFESIIKAKGECEYRQELTSTGDVITTVSMNPGAIGYASVASVKDSVKALTIDGVSPTKEAIKDGSYVIQRPFILVTKENSELSESSKLFMEFAISEAVHEIIYAAGAVPAN